MTTGKILGTATLLIALAFGSLSAQAESRTVVATILPIHSLVAGLVGEIHAVEVLLPASASPHGYAMRPSEARTLQNAELLVWVGPDLETFLERPLSEPLGGRTVISLMDDLELDLLPVRKGGIWELHDHDAHDAAHGHDHHGHDHEPRKDAPAGHDHGHHDHGHADEHQDHREPVPAVQDPDPHLWLSPAVTRQIAVGLTERLALWDPAHAEAFERNRDALIARIDALEADIARQLEPVRDRPFLVFHDAYQYFEHHFGLNAAGSITLDPALSPGARRVQELRTRLQTDDVSCLFTEPQFRPALAQTLVEGTKTDLGELDPVGSELEPGPDAWFLLMQNLADDLTDCLSAPDR
jgi:zinc transport system substrate-binding protein